MRLLLAVDSITTLEILLNEITARSWPKGTEARVLSIVEDAEVPLETWREQGYGIAAVRHEMRRRGEQITALALSRLQANGIQAEITVMRGNPDFLISLTAEKWSADLIFIRAHNRVDFRNWILGSVAKRVVDSAPCSVEIVRSGAANPFAVNRPMRILLATDGSDVSLAASQAVAETIWPADTEMKVVSVVNPIVYSLDEIGFFRGKGTERAHRAIGDTMNVLRSQPFEICAEVIAGRTVQGIIDSAKNWHADLIVLGNHQGRVLGTHQGRGLKRLLWGGTSAAVVNRAHCSVRLVRGRVASQTESLSPRSSPSVQNDASAYKSLGWRKAA